MLRGQCRRYVVAIEIVKISYLILMKYTVNYTKKEYDGLNQKFFALKKKAAAWIKKNENMIYWSEIVESKPESKLPRLVAKFEIPNDWTKYTGTLCTYFETGLECLYLTLQRNDPELKGPLNPNFDETRPEGGSNFRNFSTYEAMVDIRDGQVLELPTGEKICMLRDRDFAKRDGGKLSFYPQGFDKAEWLSLFDSGVVVTLWEKKRP